jgi:predicted  nucleic acid-binding Zn-ribbon protein
VEVQRSLGRQKNAVAVQERRIEQLQGEWNDRNDRNLHRRADAERLELDLAQKDEQVAKLRAALNTAKTNKEYAAILTQINTSKADNAKYEEQALAILADVEAIRAVTDELKQKIEAETAKLDAIRSRSNAEIARLDALASQITTERDEAAQNVPEKALALFDRVAESYDGEAMAAIEVRGKKPPHTYVCGGCYMSLNAEHANALRVRDEIRTCGNCGRILFLEWQTENSTAS